MNVYDVMFQRYAPTGELEGTFAQRVVAHTREEAIEVFNGSDAAREVAEAGGTVFVVNVALVGAYDPANYEDAGPGRFPRRQLRQYLLTYGVHSAAPSGSVLEGSYRQFVYAYNRDDARQIFLEREDIAKLTREGKTVIVLWVDDLGPWRPDAGEGTGAERTN